MLLHLNYLNVSILYITTPIANFWSCNYASMLQHWINVNHGFGLLIGGLFYIFFLPFFIFPTFCFIFYQVSEFLPCFHPEVFWLSPFLIPALPIRVRLNWNFEFESAHEFLMNLNLSSNFENSMNLNLTLNLAFLKWMKFEYEFELRLFVQNRAYSKIFDKDWEGKNCLSEKLQYSASLQS